MDKPLLEIRVDDMDSMPKVFYKGEEVKGKRSIDYSWVTSDGNTHGSHVFSLEFIDSKGKFPVIQTAKHERI